MKIVTVFLLGIGSLCTSEIFAGLSPLWTQDKRIVTLHDKEPIVLRGTGFTNTWWGRWIWPISDTLAAHNKQGMIPWDSTTPGFLSEWDFAKADSLGVNVMRYEFSFEVFAPGNSKRTSSLNDLKSHVRALEKRDIYTLLCMSGTPGADVPDFHIEDVLPGAERTSTVFESDSLDSLWAQTWQWLALQLKDDSAIAGFEIINEPRLPSTSEISEMAVASRYVDLLQRIRSEDPKRIVLIPEFHSLERNDAKQSISWDRLWPKVPDTLQGVVMVYHLYDPWTFVNDGAKSFNAQQVKNIILSKQTWADSMMYPLMVTEYGVNYMQLDRGNTAKALEWLQLVHSTWDSLGTSSTWFTFKGIWSPWYDLPHDFALFGDIQGHENWVTIQNDSLVWTGFVEQMAALANGLDTVLQQSFFTGSALQRYGSTQNHLLISQLMLAFQGKGDSLIVDVQEFPKKKRLVCKPTDHL